MVWKNVMIIRPRLKLLPTVVSANLSPDWFLTSRFKRGVGGVILLLISVFTYRAC